VRARQYRVRILNGAVSRIMAIGLVQEVAGQGGELPGPAGSGKSYNRVPFHMIANDGNILEHAVPFDGNHDYGWGLTAAEWKGQLPSHTIAERYDIVVDFSASLPEQVVLRQHHGAYGQRDQSKVPADILSGKYNPIVNGGKWINGDRLSASSWAQVSHGRGQVDLSMNVRLRAG
jgi:hypothetical protein